MAILLVNRKSHKPKGGNQINVYVVWWEFQKVAVCKYGIIQIPQAFDVYWLYVFVFVQSKKYCLGFWELQSLARMKYHSISNKTSGYTGFISSLCCWTHLSYELSGTSLTLLVFPFEGSQVCWMKFPHNFDLLKHLISPCHKEGTNEWGEITDKPMQHSEKELICFLLSEKVNATLQCSWLSTFLLQMRLRSQINVIKKMYLWGDTNVFP